MPAASIAKNSALLVLLAAVAAGLAAITFQVTEARVAEAARRSAQQMLFEIVPESRHDNDLLQDTLVLPAVDAAQLQVPASALIHVARRGGEPVAFIIPTTATEGYNGPIHLLVGVNLDGSVAGVRVVEHAETPGLGDRIELAKNDWIIGFNNRSLNNPVAEQWRVKKDGGDFDQFAGATITPRAVVGQVQAVLAYVREHRAELLAQATSAPSHRPLEALHE